MADKFIGPDGTIYEALPGGGFQIVSQQAAPQSITIGTPDPAAALDRAKKVLDLEKGRRDAANDPYESRKKAADAIKAEIEAEQAKKNRDNGGKDLAQIPPAAFSGIQENLTLLRKLDKALQSTDPKLGGRPQSIGPGTGFFGDTFTQYNDPDGVDTRAKVGELAGQKIHDVSGAAVSASEAPRFTPYVPSVTDRPETAVKKLQNFRDNLADLIREQGAAYSPANGYRPYVGADGPLKVPNSPQPKSSDSSDKTTKFYGNAANNGGDSGGDMQLAGGTQTVADPVLKGVNAKINGMLKAGAPDDQIRQYIASTGANASPASVNAALDFRRKNRDYKGNYSVNLETKDVPLSTARQAFQTVGAGPVGAYATGAADALTAGRLDNIAGAVGGNAAQVDAAKALLAKANPLSSILGNVTGGALAAGGIEMGLARSGLAAAPGIAGAISRAPLVPDAAYGATLGSDDLNNPLLGAIMGAGLGAAGGYAGQRVAGAIGGVQAEAAQALRARGVPLTLGQAVGQNGRVGAAIKGVEDRLSGIPVIGAFANARRREGMEGYNRAAFDEALAPIGQTTNGLIAETGVEAAQNSVGDAYNNALGGVNVRADLPFVQGMAGAMRGARALPEPMAGRADYTLRTRVGNSFSPNRELTGEGYQQSLRGLRRDSAAVRNEPYGYDFGNVAGQAEDALGGLLNRQAPGVVPAVERANQAYRQMQVVKEAVNRAKNGARSGEPGLFAPSQLVDASAQNSRRFGGTQGTTNQPFFALNRDAQTVLPNAVPDSGTAGRLALTGLLAGGGAGAGYFGDDTSKGLAIGGALAALQTQAAQRLLVRAVLDRPELLRRAGASPVTGAIGGAIGAPLALQALPFR